MTWNYTEATGEFGLFVVKVWDKWVSDSSRVPVDTDVTFYRDVPTQIQQMSEQDPFGPTDATLHFPAITGFDSFGAGGDIPWMKEFENVDIYYLPCSATSQTSLHGFPEATVLNPLTNSTYLYVHEYELVGSEWVPIKPVWEGFFTSITPTPTGTTVSCKGALYQLDRYYSKPLNPMRPKRTEEMISRYFAPDRRGLWTQPLVVDWTNVSRTYTQWDADRLYAQGGIRFLPTGPDGTGTGSNATQDNTAGLELGTPWTTWVTRNTGGWDKALTGYVQWMLATMYAVPNDVVGQPTYLRPGEPAYGTGITNGDQWTIAMDPGRQPRLYLRRQAASPTIHAHYGAPGVECDLTRESEQIYNVVFAQGTGSDGISWNGVVPMDSSTFISWEPIWPEAAADNLYVGWEGNNDLKENYDGYYASRERANGQYVSERYISDFPSGIDYDDAKRIARMWAERDANPGWSGTITIEVDLKDPAGNTFSRWDIRPGDIILLKGFQGHMAEEQWVNKFHVSQVTKDPMRGAVQMTVDTKFRDILTIEHALASGKDSLSVVLSNRTNQMMNQVQDLIAPWSANKGAGVIPTTSHKNWTKTESFPYTGFTSSPTLGFRPMDLFKPAFKNAGSGFDTTTSDPGWVVSQPQMRVIRMLENPRTPGPHPYALSLENALIDGLDVREYGLYVPIQAGAVNKSRRWAFFPVLLSQAGSIMRTEFACYKGDGTLAPVEFSVTLYNASGIYQTEMPRNQADPVGQYSALWDGAFEKNQRNGAPWPPLEQDYHWGTDLQQIGWGTYDRPCGYYPGTKDFAAVSPTGMMVDGGQWPFNMDGVQDWSKYSTAEYDKVPATAISWWVAVYVQIPGHEVTGDPSNALGLNWVYLRGRLFRSVNIGSGS